MTTHLLFPENHKSTFLSPRIEENITQPVIFKFMLVKYKELVCNGMGT